jgi:hypothetical protein
LVSVDVADAAALGGGGGGSGTAALGRGVFGDIRLAAVAVCLRFAPDVVENCGHLLLVLASSGEDTGTQREEEGGNNVVLVFGVVVVLLLAIEIAIGFRFAVTLGSGFGAANGKCETATSRRKRSVVIIGGAVASREAAGVGRSLRRWRGLPLPYLRSRSWLGSSARRPPSPLDGIVGKVEEGEEEEEKDDDNDDDPLVGVALALSPSC